MLINGKELDIHSLTNLFREDLSGVDLHCSDLSFANLSQSDLSNTNLHHSDLYRANLSHANLSNTIFYCADLSHADLSDSNVFGADFTGANLSHANLLGTSLIDMRRIDGYRFIGWIKNGILQINAGCRNFSIERARIHWSRTRAGTSLGDETFAILDYMESVVKIRGLTF